MKGFPELLVVPFCLAEPCFGNFPSVSHMVGEVVVKKYCLQSITIPIKGMITAYVMHYPPLILQPLHKVLCAVSDHVTVRCKGGILQSVFKYTKANETDTAMRLRTYFFGELIQVADRIMGIELSSGWAANKTFPNHPIKMNPHLMVIAEKTIDGKTGSTFKLFQVRKKPQGLPAIRLDMDEGK